MFNRLEASVIETCRAAVEDGTVIDHSVARQIADVYSWSWVTCWFAGNGEIAHPLATEKYLADPVAALSQAFFGWWHEGPDGQAYAPGEQEIADAFVAYLADRVSRGELGAVSTW